MRLIIRRGTEGIFFRSPNLWVDAVNEATVVDSLQSALKCLHGQDLSGLQLMVLSDKGHPTVGFSLSDLATIPPRIPIPKVLEDQPFDSHLNHRFLSQQA